MIHLSTVIHLNLECQCHLKRLNLSEFLVVFYVQKKHQILYDRLTADDHGYQIDVGIVGDTIRIEKRFGHILAVDPDHGVVMIVLQTIQ